MMEKKISNSSSNKMMGITMLEETSMMINPINRSLTKKTMAMEATRKATKMWIPIGNKNQT